MKKKVPLIPFAAKANGNVLAITHAENEKIAADQLRQWLEVPYYDNAEKLHIWEETGEKVEKWEPK